MGCCLSRNDDSKKNPPLPLVSDADISRLPPLLEEETVKEVLSETPSLKKPPSFRKVEEKEEQKIHLPSMLLLPTFPKKEEPHEEKKERRRIIEKEAPFIVNHPQEISEISSEICSLSESYSTTTVTERNKEDDDERSSYGEVRQRVVDRSPTKGAPRRRSNRSEYGGVPDRGRKSPARRSEPSPGRRNDSNALKSANGAEPLKSVNSAEVLRGRRRISGNYNNNRNWKDPGECSGRRSRSPSTRLDSGQVMKPGIARSPSSRKTGRSPSRIPSFAPESSRRLIEETKEEDNASANESLENPLVSLECFIFL